MGGFDTAADGLEVGIVVGTQVGDVVAKADGNAEI